jgi:hypothetical protein
MLDVHRLSSEQIKLEKRERIERRERERGKREKRGRGKREKREREEKRKREMYGFACLIPIPHYLPEAGSSVRNLRGFGRFGQ